MGDVTTFAAGFLADPTLAYLLFVVGLLALFTEVAHPGGMVPGGLGVISSVLALVAFAALPVDWSDALLIAFAVALFVVELHAPSHGVFALIGLACLSVGSLMLYRPVAAGMPAIHVATSVVVTMVVVTGAFGAVVVRSARAVARLGPLNDVGLLVGATGVADTALAPEGVIHVRGEQWSAHTDAGTVAQGETVRVLARNGLTLEVTPVSRRTVRGRLEP